MKNITIYTDGGCRGNGKTTNIGAYAFIVKDEAENTNEVSESFDNTTNNQMELLGLIKGLESLPLKSRVNAYSDSKYVCDAINNGWIDNWLKNGWKTSKKESVKNKDLWERLIAICKKHDVTIKWVKGHSTDKLNNRCDEILNTCMDNHVVKFVSTPITISEKVTGFFTESDEKKHKDVLRRLYDLRREVNDIIKHLEV